MSADLKRAAIVAFALSIASALASYLAAGATLGLLIGSIAFAALITPPLALAVSHRTERALIAIAIVLGNIVIWMFALRIVDSLACASVLLAFTLALVALTHACRTSTLTTLIALAWLSFPMWLRSEVSASLVVVHPVFAMNGACKHLGIWTQQPIMYRITTLGQDVPYELPASVWPCVIAHGIIGLLLFIPSRGRARAGDELADRQTRSTPPPAPQESHTS